MWNGILKISLCSYYQISRLCDFFWGDINSNLFTLDWPLMTDQNIDLKYTFVNWWVYLQEHPWGVTKVWTQHWIVVLHQAWSHSFRVGNPHLQLAFIFCRFQHCSGSCAEIWGEGLLPSASMSQQSCYQSRKLNMVSIILFISSLWLQGQGNLCFSHLDINNIIR